ncbi:MAG: type VII secretion protein EccB [Micromonosporaceae bacterium]
MATRRDQLHSYQFLTQRVISAFVMRETDPQQSPLRRGVGAVFAGIMITILVAAGFGVYGIISRVGSDQWQVDGAVVVEKETGASFVYFDGTLHPALNYASAMLAAGRPNPPVFRVASNSLSSTPRATVVGIPGAPDSLPSADKRVGLPWTVCAMPGTDRSGRQVSMSLLAVATVPDGATRLGDEGVLVREAGQERTYLVWHGRRYLIQQPDRLVPALFGAVTPVPVDVAWLNALPAGSDIAAVSVSSRGKASAAVPNHANGEVLTVQTGSGPQHYLVLNNGLAPITELQKTVLGATYQVRVTEVAPSVVTSLPRSSQLGDPGGEEAAPAAAPKLQAPGAGGLICAVTADAKAAPAVYVGGVLPGADTATPTAGTSRDGVPLADGVLVPAGRVATVRVLGAPTAGSGPYYVVTDLGIKYPVPSPDVLQMLGYPPAEAVDVPAALIARLPTGPALDPEAALQPAQITTDG